MIDIACRVSAKKVGPNSCTSRVASSAQLLVAGSAIFTTADGIAAAMQRLAASAGTLGRTRKAPATKNRKRGRGAK
jgi:hypothetical protein